MIEMVVAFAFGSIFGYLYCDYKQQNDSSSIVSLLAALAMTVLLFIFVLGVKSALSYLIGLF